MGAYRHSHVLLDVVADTNVPQVGPTFELAGTDPYQEWGVVLHITQLGGVTSPTVTGQFDVSADGVNWSTFSQTSLFADGTKDVRTLQKDLPKYVRGSSALSGATLPNHTVKVVLVSTKPFAIKQL